MEKKILNSWIEEVERLRAENKSLTVCRDHWKISYETRNAENKELKEKFETFVKLVIELSSKIIVKAGKA